MKQIIFDTVLILALLSIGVACLVKKANGEQDPKVLQFCHEYIGQAIKEKPVVLTPGDGELRFPIYRGNQHYWKAFVQPLHRGDKPRFSNNSSGTVGRIAPVDFDLEGFIKELEERP